MESDNKKYGEYSFVNYDTRGVCISMLRSEKINQNQKWAGKNLPAFIIPTDFAGQ